MRNSKGGFSRMMGQQEDQDQVDPDDAILFFILVLRDVEQIIIYNLKIILLQTKIFYLGLRTQMKMIGHQIICLYLFCLSIGNKTQSHSINHKKITKLIYSMLIQMQFLYILLFTLSLSHQDSNEKIQKLGIMIRHDHSIQLQTIFQYVSRFIDPKCEIIDEISIVSRQSKNSELSKLKQKYPSLINPPLSINLQILAQGSRFNLKIPANSQSKLYFIGNVKSQQTCQQIGKYLSFAQSHMLANLVPLIGEQQSTSVIHIDNSKKIFQQIFQYSQSGHSSYYLMVENIRLLSRHFIQLAQSSIRQVKLMADSMESECEQILLNFVAAHFYPELRSKLFAFKGTLSSLQSKSFDKKSTCIRQFIKILGYVPPFYQKKIFNKTIWRNPNIEKTLQLKKLTLNSYLANNNNPRLMTTIEQQSGQIFARRFSQQILAIFILSAIVIILAVICLRLSKLVSEQRMKIFVSLSAVPG